MAGGARNFEGLAQMRDDHWRNGGVLRLRSARFAASAPLRLTREVEMTSDGML